MKAATGLTILIAMISGAAVRADGPAPEPHAAARPKVGVRDSLDGAIDLSDRLIEANGFVPVPIVITEPALGGFGAGLALVFLKKQPPLESDGQQRPIPPDITAGAAAYTANDTWFAGGARSATLARQRVRYRVAGGDAHLNLDFYETLPSGDDRAFGITGRSTAAMVWAGRMLGDPRYVVGAEYMFLHTELRLANDHGNLPDFLTDQVLESNIGQLAVTAEFDGRDNIFTPDRGHEVYGEIGWSDDWLGGDFEFGRIRSHVFWYTPVGASRTDGRGWVSGLRLDWQQSLGDPPFYMVPSIQLRGVPALRYQGRTNLLAETEQRWDVTRRWSGVMFGGLGKAFDDADDFSDADWVYSYGAGFRYLTARKFKLRMGVDIARGPEEWAYYLIFGSAWIR